MEKDHMQIELVAGGAVVADLAIRVIARANSSFYWKILLILALPFYCLFICLLAILVSLRLALANADRVIFVFATSILSLYQVPRTVFYVYIAVLLVTGILQFLKDDSAIRVGLLNFINGITRSKANIFLRKYSRSMHYSNPYARLRTPTQTIFIPVGCALPIHSSIEVFEFSVSDELSFERKVGDCMMIVRTLSGLVRYLEVKAPWGVKSVSFSMKDENLGRLINYLHGVAAEKLCTQVICTHSRYFVECRALTIGETIEHFNVERALSNLSFMGKIITSPVEILAFEMP